jgi:hypothetical protein
MLAPVNVFTTTRSKVSPIIVRTFVPLKKSLIFIHRWLGVVLCLLFLLWFISGIVMMYWDFPSVSAQDRLDRSPVLDASKIQLSPAEAYTKLETQQPPSQVRLNIFDGRPVYRFRAGRGERLIYADTGEEQIFAPPEMIQGIAVAWTGQPSNAVKMESVEEVDQWTVQGGLRNLRPLWKYSWPNGEQVYVSGASGEVVQYTTTTSRFWAYLGAIPHWLYFTPLRKHQAWWNQLVIWTSGLGTLAAILGIAVGIWMYSPAKHYRYAGAATSIPYLGQKRLHMIMGLIFGVTAATWAFSGFLSMDPFPARTGGPAGGGTRGSGKGGTGDPNIPGALRGRFQLSAFNAKPPNKALAQIADLKVKELEFTSFAGEMVYLATLKPGETRIVPVFGEPMAEFDKDRIIEIVKKAVGSANLAELRLREEYDAYYLDRHHHRPLPVILVRLNDAENNRYYIDPKTARVVGHYNSSRWVTRWLYHGLHSLDFPWLYRFRPLWDIVVISLILGGTVLCATSLILAWRVLRRKIIGLVAARSTRDEARPNEDLDFETE